MTDSPPAAYLSQTGVSSERLLSYRWYDPQVSMFTERGAMAKPAIEIRVRFDADKQDPEVLGWELTFALKAMIIALRTGNTDLDQPDLQPAADAPEPAGPDYPIDDPADPARPVGAQEVTE